MVNVAVPALVYNAMFYAAGTLIRSQGYKPGNKLQHIGIIEAVKRTLGEDFEAIIFLSTIN